MAGFHRRSVSGVLDPPLPFPPMDTFLAIASRRETRDYSNQPIPDEVTQLILDAGRLAGSAAQQAAVAVPDRRGRDSAGTARRGHLRADQRAGCAAGGRDRRPQRPRHRPLRAEHVARRVEGRRGLRPRRAARPEADRQALEADGTDEEIAIVLTFGYPARERDAPTAGRPRSGAPARTASRSTSSSSGCRRLGRADRPRPFRTRPEDCPRDERFGERAVDIAAETVDNRACPCLLRANRPAHSSRVPGTVPGERPFLGCAGRCLGSDTKGSDPEGRCGFFGDSPSGDSP